MSKKIKTTEDLGATTQAALPSLIGDPAESSEVYITVEPVEIDRYHGAGVKEIAIRNGREFVFRRSDIAQLLATSMNHEHDSEGEKDA